MRGAHLVALGGDGAGPASASTIASIGADVPGPRRSSSAFTASGSVRIRRMSSMARELVALVTTTRAGFRAWAPGGGSVRRRGPGRRRRLAAWPTARWWRSTRCRSRPRRAGHVRPRPQRRRQDLDHRVPRGPAPAGEGPAFGPRPRPARDHAALTPRIGVMLQEGGVHPAVRVAEVLRHGAALYPSALDVGALVDRLGLAGLERRAWRQLSGGEQRRVALGLALVGSRRWPSSTSRPPGSTSAGRQVIREVVGELRAGGVAVLRDHPRPGRGRAHRRRRRGHRPRPPGRGRHPRRPPGRGGRGRRRAVLRPAAASTSSPWAATSAAWRWWRSRSGRYEVGAPPAPATVAAITAWLAERELPLADLQAGRQRLEDVFVQLTSSPDAARRRSR